MNRRYYLLLTIMLFAFSPLHSARAGQALTLEDCLSLARENNTRLIQARTSRGKALSGITSARSGFYPSVELSSEYRLTGDTNNVAASIGARYSLFQGGYDRARVGQARAEVQLAGESYRLTEIEVAYEVKEVFFTILSQQEQVKLAAEIVERRREDLILIKLKYDSGRENRPAVKEAEASLLQAEYDLMAAERELDLARVQLNLLLARPGKEDFTLSYQDRETNLPALDTVITEARENRPEIRSQRTSREIYRSLLTQAKSRYSPDLFLSSSYGFQGESFSEQEDSWSAGISLSWPLFTGFATRAEVSEAKFSLAGEEEKIREISQQIEEEVVSAWHSLHLARKKQEVSSKTLEAAREMYQLTKLEYEQGLTSYFFFQQKEDALSRAEYSYINALYTLRLAQAGLYKARGKNGE